MNENEKDQERVRRRAINGILFDALEETILRETRKCPECGSSSLSGSRESVYAYEDSAYPQRWCKDCGFVLPPFDVLLWEKIEKQLAKNRLE